MKDVQGSSLIIYEVSNQSQVSCIEVITHNCSWLSEHLFHLDVSERAVSMEVVRDESRYQSQEPDNSSVLAQ